MSAKALQKTPSALIDTVRTLDKQLQSWRESMPQSMKPRDHLKSFQMPPNGRSLADIIIHYSYYGNLIGIHTPFAYPWLFAEDETPDMIITEQIRTSSNRVAAAARNIIIMARQSLEINGTSTQGYLLLPHWPYHPCYSKS